MAMIETGACRRRDAVRELGEYRVRTAVETGEFASPWAGVLVEPRRASEPVTVVSAAWLACGVDAVVAGPTAAFLHGYTAAEPTPVHLMVPYESHKRPRPGLVVHNGRGLVEDRVVRHGLPMLSGDRVVTDLLCTARPSTALAVLDQALAALDGAARKAFCGRVGDRLRDRPDPRGTRVGARLLELATGRAESPAESWLLWHIVDLGFPVPEVNHWVCTINGEPRYRVDLAWPALRIALEYHGHAAHAERHDEDAVRILDLERRGWIVIEVRAGQVDSVEAAVQDAFRRRGMDLERTTGSLRARRHRERWAS